MLQHVFLGPYFIAMFEFLIIEDNRALGDMGKALIEERYECQGHLVRSRAELNLLLEQYPGRFAIAVVDLNLPDAPDGEVLADVIAANIPAIVFTGSYGEDMREQMLNFGVVDYVVKTAGLYSYEYIADLIGRVQKNRQIAALIIDDSRSFAGVLGFQLGIQRLNVYTAGSAEEGQELLEKHSDIRLVFVDYHLPDKQGFEVCHNIRARYGKDRLALIGMSGSGDKRLVARFLKSGANDYLAKPFEYEELLCRVNQNLDILDQIAIIRETAERDFLTRLHNRRFFFKQGNADYLKARSRQLPMSMVMLDIDLFKSVNDRFGHDGGDEALRHIAGLLREHFPEALLARIGGEEFSILLLQDSKEVGRRLEIFRAAVESSPVNTANFDFSFTVSIGFTDVAGEDIDEMLAIADSGLYRAKQSGRNRVEYCHSLQGENLSGAVRQRQRVAKA